MVKSLQHKRIKLKAQQSILLYYYNRHSIVNRDEWQEQEKNSHFGPDMRVSPPLEHAGIPYGQWF